MGIHPSRGVLTEMTHIVIAHINGGGISLTANSDFARQLEEIQVPERRDLLRDYVSDGTFMLLCGIIDQVRSLDQVLAAPDASVSAYILVRATLEYSYKIAYLAEPYIDPEERVCRALRLYCTDLEQYRKMPEDLKPNSAGEVVTKHMQPAEEWYQEIACKKLRSVSAREIMDKVWNSDDEQGYSAGNNGEVGNPIYDKGYRIGSTLTHGNIWAIRHYGLTMTLIENRVVTSSGLKEKVVGDLLLIAAGCLMYSFGFIAQLMNRPPTGTVNRLEHKITMIRMGQSAP